MNLMKHPTLIKTESTSSLIEQHPSGENPIQSKQIQNVGFSHELMKRDPSGLGNDHSLSPDGGDAHLSDNQRLPAYYVTAPRHYSKGRAYSLFRMGFGA